MKTKLLKYSVIISLIFTLVINTLSTTGALNNIDTAAISENYTNFFVPAGYVFSIWGIIYSFMIAFTVYQFRYEVSNKIRTNTILINLLNALWLFMWHYDHLELSVGVMIMILVLLIHTFLEIKKIDLKTFAARASIKYTFSVYLGWISVATIANISATLTKNNWSRLGLADSSWAVIMLFIGALLGLAMLMFERNKAYNLVLIWAFIGIFVKFPENIVGTAAILTAAVLAVAVAFETFRKYRSQESAIGSQKK